MLKWREFIKNIFFWIFFVFSLFLDFFENISKTWVKNWVATDAPSLQCLRSKILNVLHCKLCKENKRKMISLSWATCPHTHTGLFSRATCPHILKLVYFQGRPAHTLTLVCFHGRPAHTLTLVCFHKRPAHTYSIWVVRLNWDPFADPLQPEPKSFPIRLNWDPFADPL